jgi:alpha,alpha-trehalase
LLYKYEMDIAETIQGIFGDSFETPFFAWHETLTASSGEDPPTTMLHTSAEWLERARIRQARINKHCWNEERGMYFDYDTRLKTMGTYESVTTFYTMWAGCADREKAERMM